MAQLLSKVINVYQCVMMYDVFFYMFVLCCTQWCERLEERHAVVSFVSTHGVVGWGGDDDVHLHLHTCLMLRNRMFLSDLDTCLMLRNRMFHVGVGWGGVGWG